jgi:hypothetical protein
MTKLKNNSINNKPYLILILALIILAFPLISAERYEDNYFKYGTININGQLVATNTAINNVNILGIICSSNNCATSSGKLWANALTSNNDFIKLTYPTNLLSTFGYGIYIYKENYIPYEISADWWGTNPNDPLGPYNNYLTKKESCVSSINSLEVNYENNIINVNANIKSPISNAGTLAYLPEELKSYYSANVNLKLEIKKDAQIFYTETKPLTMLFSESRDITFSKEASQSGEYEIKVYTTLENEQKCLAYTQDSKQVSLVIPEPPEPPECICNSDCGTEDYTDNYCEDNKIYRDLRQFICNQGKCEKKITKELVKTCNNGCNTITNECNPEIIICSSNADCGTDGCIGTANYCKNNSVYQDFIYFTCHNSGQFNSYCSNQILPFLIKTCEHGCFNNGICNQPIDNNPPVITLVSPENNAEKYKESLSFTYNVADESEVSVCKLILQYNNQEMTVNSSTAISKTSPNILTHNFNMTGEHKWKILCADAFNNTGFSDARILNIIEEQQPICQTDSDCGQQTFKNICQDDNLTKEIATPKCIIDNVNNQNNKCQNTTTFEFIKECKHGCEIKNNIAKCDSAPSNVEKCYDEYGDLIDCDEQAQLELNPMSKKSSSSIEEIMKTIANQANISQYPTQYLKPLFQSESFSITYILYAILILILFILIIILIILSARKPRKKHN